MEAHGLYVPSLWHLPSDQSHAPLRAAGRSGGCPRTHDVLIHVVISVDCIRDIYFRQEHEVVVPQMGCSDFLRNTKSADVPDIVCTNMYSGNQRNT